MSKPFEIIAAPFTLWWAPTGEAFPAIDEDPAGNWTRVGTSGSRNYSNDGVTVRHPQTVNTFRTLGSTGPVKAVREEEDLVIAMTLFDITLEQYRLALNNNTVTTTAADGGAAGFKELPAYRGFDVTLLSLLVRGPSPEGAGWNLQYQVPVCFAGGEPEVVYRKAEPAGLALEFTAMEDLDAASDSARFGQLVVQHQDPL